MARPTRDTGINPKRLRRLRRREGWSQTELAEKLGVHRMTLSRWEAGKADPPLDVAASISELFRVDPEWLFEADPEPLRERDNPNSAIQDDMLRHHTLANLQRCTKSALKAMGLTSEELAKRVDLPVNRLQDLLNGHKPTGYEIQCLKTQLGREFNPVLTSQRVDKEGITVEGMMELTLKRVNLLHTRQEAFETELLQRIFRLETLHLDVLQKVDRLLKMGSGQN